MKICGHRLEQERSKRQRDELNDESPSCSDNIHDRMVHIESGRDFLHAMETFIFQKALKLAKSREHVKMLPGGEDDDRIDWSVADDGMSYLSYE
jgi:hypothetical protein